MPLRSACHVYSFISFYKLVTNFRPHPPSPEALLTYVKMNIVYWVVMVSDSLEFGVDLFLLNIFYFTYLILAK